MRDFAADDIYHYRGRAMKFDDDHAAPAEGCTRKREAQR